MANYTANTWNSGDTITKTKMDRLEAGAAAALPSADAPELIRDTMGAALVAGSNITITPSDGTDTITIAAATSGASGIPASTVDAKGDLIAATAADTVARLAVGTNGLALVAASGQATGLQWAAPAPASHNHAASDVTSGTVATARLGSGTASSSTYLRGDQTWATVSGGTDARVSGVAIYAKDYGAVGDDTTNDTTALQNAINAVTTAAPWGGTLFLEQNKFYKIATSALTVPSYINIEGCGAVIRQSTANANCLSIADGVNISIHNLKLSGPTEGSHTGTGKGIVSTISANPDTHRVVLREVEVTSFGSHGIELANPILSGFYNVTSEANGGHGFYIHGVNGGAAGTSCVFDATYANGNAQAGYHLDTMTYCSFNGAAADSNGIGYSLLACEAIAFNGCGAEGTLKNNTTYNGFSWKINACVAVTLFGCWVYANPNLACWITGNSTSCVIAGFRENSPTGTAVHNIQRDAGSSAAITGASGTSSNLLNGTSLGWL